MASPVSGHSTMTLDMLMRSQLIRRIRTPTPKLVNERLMAKLSVNPPNDRLIRGYLLAIADHFKIESYSDNDDQSTDPNLGLGYSIPSNNFAQAYVGEDPPNNNHPGSHNGMGGDGFGGGMPYQQLNTAYQPQAPSNPYVQTNQGLQSNTEQSILPSIVDVNAPNNVQNNFSQPIAPSTQNMTQDVNTNFPNMDNIPQATIYNPQSNTTSAPSEPSFDDLQARLRDLKR